MKTYIYKVLIEPDEDRYHAEIPALPGCYSWGYTYEEAVRNIQEAAELWLQTLFEDGEPIPEEDPDAFPVWFSFWPTLGDPPPDPTGERTPPLPAIWSVRADCKNHPV